MQHDGASVPVLAHINPHMGNAGGVVCTRAKNQEWKDKDSRSRNWERSTGTEKSVESDGKSSRADCIKRSF